MTAEWRERLAAYDDEHLDPAERAALDRLLDADPEAREHLAALRRDMARFKEAFAAVEARDDFTQGVLDRLGLALNTEPVPPKADGGWRLPGPLPIPLPRLLEAVAAVMMVAIGISLFTPRLDRERQRQLACQTNVRDLHRAMLNYTQDYDGRLPSADRWVVQVNDYVEQPSALWCPSDSDAAGQTSYGMPLGLSNADIRTLPEAESPVTLFDAVGLLPAPRHDRGRAAVAATWDGDVHLIRGLVGR